jgi:hypothetical protein
MKVQIDIVRTEFRVLLRLRWNGEDWRAARADAFRFAAMIEERSGTEPWCVVVGDGIESLGRGLLGGHVGVELATGDAGEVDRAESLLRQIALEWQAR